MKISVKTKKQANQVISKYTRGLITCIELQQMYNELDELGITFLIRGDCTEKPVMTYYELEGETVENSRMVFGFYYPSSTSKYKFELTCYLS